MSSSDVMKTLMQSHVDGHEVEPLMMDEENVPDDAHDSDSRLEFMSSEDYRSVVLS